MPISIALAGTTNHTVACAESLRVHPNYTILWVLTPAPKPVGRDQMLQKNPLHRWAETHHIPVILIDKKIDEAIQNEVSVHTRPDILLVVDFGYRVPNWLLSWPSTAPLNIHPSDLPRWRGSSPGQFALLYGDTESAICLMQMSEGMDEGAIFYRVPFAIQPDWTQREYYAESFALIAPQLPEFIQAIYSKQVVSTPQPVVMAVTATPSARKLAKTDSYIPWKVLTSAMAGKAVSFGQDTPELLQTAHSAHPHLASLLASATRACAPWPLLWTVVETTKGTKRMQVLKSHVVGRALVLDQVKIEGKTAMSWKEAEKSII